MPKKRMELVRGTLDMMIMRTLLDGAKHGYAITQSIEETTDETLQVDEGSMYPALYRMEKKGWIESNWGRSENNRRARFYRLTEDGRRQLDREEATWARFIQAVSKVMQRA